MTTQINFIACIALLTNARSIIWNGLEGGRSCEPRGKERFVCCAIDDVRPLASDVFEANYLRKLIKSYIDGASTFEFFYAKKNGMNVGDVTAADCYLPRLDMIDAMIRHCTFMAILENASARMWDGVDPNKTMFEHKKATYMCHAVGYAIVDVLKFEGKQPANYASCDLLDAEGTELFRTISLSIMAKLGCSAGARITADSYYREMYGDYTRQELQEFRIRTMANITAEYATRIV